MNYEVRAESGLQMLERISNRPNLKGLDHRIFGDGPSPQDIIEVTGEASVGKSMLLLQWISRAILAPSCGGLGVGVLLIDADHHQPVPTLVNIMEGQIKSYKRSSAPLQRATSTVVEALIKDALKRLTILNVYDGTQLHTVFLTLDKVLSANRHISMVAIDSLSAFYWGDRLAGGSQHMQTRQLRAGHLRHMDTSLAGASNSQHMDTYLLELLSVIQSSIKEIKKSVSTEELKNNEESLPPVKSSTKEPNDSVTIAFTRPSYFQSAVPSRSRIRDRSTIFINLTETQKCNNISSNEEIIYTALIRSKVGHVTHKYKISKAGFVWM